MKISRRTLLLSGAALWVSAASGEGVVWAASPEPLERFMVFSESATGFSNLDRELGSRYLSALLEWEPKISELLQESPTLGYLTAEQAELTDLVIEVWYTGTVPTSSGNRVVSFEQALGHRCLPRSTPVTSCR